MTQEDAQIDNSSRSEDLPEEAPKKRLEILKTQYKRAAWKHFIRYFVVATFLLLDVSTVMSYITRAQAHNLASPGQEIMFFLVVGAFNILLLLPVILEVNRVIIDKDTISLSTLFWKSKLKWSVLLEFDEPMFFKYGILRTKSGYFLINKRDFKEYKQIAETIRNNLKGHNRTA